MGGTVQYRQGGGGIQEFLSNPATGDLGQFLYRTGQNDPNAIDAFNADKKTKGAYTQKLNELDTLLSSGQITQSQYDTAKNDLLGVKTTSASELKSNEERVSANQESIDAATKAIQLIDEGAGEVLNYISRSWSEILSSGSWTDWLNDLTTATTGLIAGQERKAVEAAAHSRFAKTKQWNAYKLFSQELRLLQLKARALVKGGSISDSEAAAAAETIVTQYTDAETTKTQLKTVIDRNNKALQALGATSYTSRSVTPTITGKDYDESEDGGYEEVEVPVSEIKTGQMFKDNSDYMYEYNADTDKVIVKGSVYDGTEYQLNYAEKEKAYFIDGTTGTIILTPIKEGNVDAKNSGGLIAI